VIDKCQTGVMSTTFDSPTDAITVCSRFVFPLGHCSCDVRTVSHSVGVQCGQCKRLFVSEQDDVNTIG